MTGVLVLMASPGDAVEERSAVRDALNDWNITRGRRELIALLPWLWERHAIPRVGGRPQALINAQAVDQSDVVIAFFDSRLGTSTGVDVSGTAEEINRASDMGKFVHVYFSEEPLPRDVDPQQLLLLQAFKHDLQMRSLLGSYSDAQDLAGQVVRAIESDLDEASWGGGNGMAMPPLTPGVILHWEHDHRREQKGVDGRGNATYRTTANDLVVRNDGSLAAEGLEFNVSPVGDTQFLFEGPGEPVTLSPQSSMSWSLVPTPHMGASGRTIEIAARWAEAGEERRENRTITLR